MPGDRRLSDKTQYFIATLFQIPTAILLKYEKVLQ